MQLLHVIPQSHSVPMRRVTVFLSILSSAATMLGPEWRRPEGGRLPHLRRCTLLVCSFALARCYPSAEYGTSFRSRFGA